MEKVSANALIAIRAKNDPPDTIRRIGFYIHHDNIIGILTAKKVVSDLNVQNIIIQQFKNDNIYNFTPSDCIVNYIGGALILFISPLTFKDYMDTQPLELDFDPNLRDNRIKYKILNYFDRGRANVVNNLEAPADSVYGYGELGISGKLIKEKYFGTPILNIYSGKVIGMIVDYSLDDDGNHTNSGFYLEIKKSWPYNHFDVVRYVDKKICGVNEHFSQINDNLKITTTKVIETNQNSSDLINYNTNTPLEKKLNETLAEIKKSKKITLLNIIWVSIVIGMSISFLYSFFTYSKNEKILKRTLKEYQKELEVKEMKYIHQKLKFIIENLVF